MKRSRDNGASATPDSCRDVITLFFHHLDHRNFASAADLFQPTGVWDRHGDRLTGPERILAALAERDPAQIERHVVTNLSCVHHSPTECSMTSYVTIYRAISEGEDTPRVPGPVVLGEFHDRLDLTDDGWKFRHRTSQPVFVIGPA